AFAHTQPKDEKLLGDARSYAAAALFRLTGEAEYEAQFEKDTAGLKPGAELNWDQNYGPWIYCLGGGPTPAKPELLKRIRETVLASADLLAIINTNKRALRWGGHWGMPMLIGQ